MMNTFVFMACSSERKDFNGMCGMYTTMKLGFGIPESRISLVFNGPRASLESYCQDRIIYIQQKHVHQHDVFFDSPFSENVSTAESGIQFEALARHFAESAVGADSIIVVLSFHGMPNSLLLTTHGVLALDDVMSWILGSSHCPTLVFLNQCSSGETATLLVERMRQLVVYTSSRSGRSLILPGAYQSDAEDRICSSFLRASVLTLGEVPFRRHITIGQHLDRTTEVMENLGYKERCEPPAVFPLSARELYLDLFLPIESNKALDDSLFEYGELQRLMASHYLLMAVN
jgi:hypothetical protein